MDAKNTWISDVENSLDQLEPAQGNPYLYTRIKDRLMPVQLASMGTISIAAFFLVVLLLVNLVALNSWQPAKEMQPQQSGPPLPFQLINTNPVNYN